MRHRRRRSKLRRKRKKPRKRNKKRMRWLKNSEKLNLKRNLFIKSKMIKMRTRRHKRLKLWMDKEYVSKGKMRYLTNVSNQRLQLRLSKMMRRFKRKTHLRDLARLNTAKPLLICWIKSLKKLTYLSRALLNWWMWFQDRQIALWSRRKQSTRVNHRCNQQKVWLRNQLMQR
jgi:hypothetical protein